ncbi:MAG: FliH/SctL family protein [Sphingomonadaceae bacterium]
MPRIIKSANFRDDPVVIPGQRGSRFVQRRYLDPQGDEEQPPVAVQAQDGADLARAEARAEEILAEAEARAAAVTREAMARGYSDGKAEGLRAAEEQCKGYLERLAELAKRAVIDRETMIRSAEQELATLALEIASKIIRREVATDPTIVLAMIESAIEKVGSTESVRILVHPEDVDLVREKWSELRGAVAFGTNWEVVGDDQVDRGGCIVETKSGLVDSRIETQLAEIVTAFEVGQ